MTTQSLLKEISRDKLNKPIIQALLSQANLAVAQFHNNIQDLENETHLSRRLVAIVSQWYNIEPNFKIHFPTNFIQTAIYSYCGSAVENTFDGLGLRIDLSLANKLRKWLHE